MLKRTPLKRKTSLKKRGKTKRKRTDDAMMEKLRKSIINRDEGRCVLCGRPYQEMHHIVYRGNGGKSTMENMCCLCWHCHRIKIHGGIHPKEYRRLLQQILSDRYGYQYA